jgi:hypothetical protein
MSFATADLKGMEEVFQGNNGKHVYTNDRALYGYIETGKFLVLTPALVKACYEIHQDASAPAFTTDEMGAHLGYHKLKTSKGATYEADKHYLYYGNTASEKVELNRGIILNFQSLRKAGMSAKDAYAVAAFRMRWISLGCLFTDNDKDISGNKTPFPEIKIVSAPDPATKNAEEILLKNIFDATTIAELGKGFVDGPARLEYLNAAKDESTGVKFVVQHAECIWAIVEYLFRTRGHHFKPEYVPIIDKMLKASFGSTFTWPGGLSPSVIFHAAIHPFGVKMLPVMSFHFALLAKLSSAMLLRLDAAPNGTAVITTTSAALYTMRGEAWYAAFDSSMKGQLKEVHAISQAILSKKYSYHLSASLYDATRASEIKVGEKTYTVDEAKAMTAPVATVIQGFINYLNMQVKDKQIKSFSLQNARSLEKHAAGNPSLAAKVTMLCMIVDAALANTTDVAVGAKQVFPNLAGYKVQKEALEGEAGAIVAKA